MYSNTSRTPSPVFADVKKSLGPRSGGGGKRGIVSEAGEGRVNVGGVVAAAWSRVKRLGVMVGAEDDDVLDNDDVMRRGARTGEDGREDIDGGNGDERADAYTSNSDEDGV
jgi:hypothetical protein